MDNIQESDLVVLLVEKPEAGLHRGDVGTVIQVFEASVDHPAGFMIEFVDENGKVKAEIDITERDQIVKLRLKLDLEAA